MRLHWNTDLRGVICISIIYAYWIYGTIVPMKIIILPYYKMGIIKMHAIISKYIVVHI